MIPPPIITFRIILHLPCPPLPLCRKHAHLDRTHRCPDVAGSSSAGDTFSSLATDSFDQLLHRSVPDRGPMPVLKYRRISVSVNIPSCTAFANFPFGYFLAPADDHIVIHPGTKGPISLDLSLISCIIFSSSVNQASALR